MYDCGSHTYAISTFCTFSQHYTRIKIDGLYSKQWENIELLGTSAQKQTHKKVL